MTAEDKSKKEEKSGVWLAWLSQKEKECGVQAMQTQEKTHADTEDEARIKELSIAIRDHEEKEKEVRDRQRKHKI